LLAALESNAFVEAAIGRYNELFRKSSSSVKPIRLNGEMRNETVNEVRFRMVQYNPAQTLFADRNSEINQRKASAKWNVVAECSAETASKRRSWWHGDNRLRGAIFHSYFSAPIFPPWSLSGQRKQLNSLAAEINPLGGYVIGLIRAEIWGQKNRCC
jgi:hypothetical protein